jgi:glycosyltransferase involved in cell wall biosynthesis
MKISVVIIAKDEEKMLPECLKTVSWAQEVVVIDTGSIDKTSEIAKKSGARVVGYKEGKNFSDWRNKGLREARGEWILYVDADERIPSALVKEVEKVIQSRDTFGAYAIPRRNIVLGQELKHGGFWPDYQKRLFQKGSLKGWNGEVHEEPEYVGELGLLSEPMVHQKHESIAEMVEKTNGWSEVEASLMYKAKHPPMNIPRFISAMCREGWMRLVVHKAFLDGKIGIVFALYQVFSRFVSYAKLWEMQLKNNKQSLAK